MIESISGSTVHMICDCGARFTAEAIEDSPEVKSIFGDLRELYDGCKCEECLARAEEARKQEAIQSELAELHYTWQRRVDATGVPAKFARINEPIIRPVAEWVWRNRSTPILLSGSTGTGKTSSAVFVMRKMMERRKLRAAYYLRADFFSAFDAAQRGSGDQVFFFKKRLKNLDLLILDEFVGTDGSGALSPTHQGIIHWILDGVYSADHFPNVWLLGEFYSGAFARMLDRPDSAIRRIRHSFCCGIISGGTVQHLEIPEVQ